MLKSQEIGMYPKAVAEIHSRIVELHKPIMNLNEIVELECLTLIKQKLLNIIADQYIADLSKDV